MQCLHVYNNEKFLYDPILQYDARKYQLQSKLVLINRTVIIIITSQYNLISHSSPRYYDIRPSTIIFR